MEKCKKVKITKSGHGPVWFYTDDTFYIEDVSYIIKEINKIYRINVRKDKQNNKENRGEKHAFAQGKKYE